MKNKEKYDLTKLDIGVQGTHFNLFNKDNAQKIYEGEYISYIKLIIELLRWLEQEYIEPIKLTDDEIVILKNIPTECKWIIRFEKGGLVVCDFKPQRINTSWRIAPSMDLYLFNHLFKFIKWEDEKPYNIDELLKPYGVER